MPRTGTSGRPRAGGVRGHVPESTAFAEMPPAIGAVLRDLERQHSCELVHGLKFTRVFCGDHPIGGIVRGAGGKAYLLSRAVDAELAATLKRVGFVVGTQRSGSGQRHWYEITLDHPARISEAFGMAASRSR